MIEEDVCHLFEEGLGSVIDTLKEKIWKTVMDEEMNQIEKNDTWSLVLPPESCKANWLKMGL